MGKGIHLWLLNIELLNKQGYYMVVFYMTALPKHMKQTGIWLWSYLHCCKYQQDFSVKCLCRKLSFVALNSNMAWPLSCTDDISEILNLTRTCKHRGGLGIKSSLVERKAWDGALLHRSTVWGLDMHPTGVIIPSWLNTRKTHASPFTKLFVCFICSQFA